MTEAMSFPVVQNPPEICRYCNGKIGRIAKRRVHVDAAGDFLYTVHPATPIEWRN